jgi:hypothetical protein
MNVCCSPRLSMLTSSAQLPRWLGLLGLRLVESEEYGHKGGVGAGPTVGARPAIALGPGASLLDRARAPRAELFTTASVNPHFVIVHDHQLVLFIRWPPQYDLWLWPAESLSAAILGLAHRQYVAESDDSADERSRRRRRPRTRFLIMHSHSSTFQLRSGRVCACKGQE